MNSHKRLIFLLIIVTVMIVGIVLICLSNAKTKSQNDDVQSLAHSVSEQLTANHSEEFSLAKQPIQPGDAQADQKPDKFMLQSKEIIKKIRHIMKQKATDDCSDSLSASELEIIESYDENSETNLIEKLELQISEDDDDSLDLQKSLQFIMKLLKAYAEGNTTVNYKFVKDFMEKIGSHITYQVSDDNLATLEANEKNQIMKDVPMMINYLKSFLIYEYIVLTNDSGYSKVNENAINNLITILTSKAKTLSDKYKDNYMYYNAAFLLSNFIIDSNSYKNMVRTLSTWEQKYKDSFAKCKTENSDTFKFYSSTYKLLEIIDEN